jgi:MFS transporter, FHS family, glucose/mannose:H+ symporter
LIEQSFGTWLPTFNREILMLPNAMSVQMASILAGATALGRISAGMVLRRVPWYVLLNVCVLGDGTLVVVTLPLASSVVARPGVGWFNAPIAAYVIPLIGLLMAPIYPVINSVALSSLPKTLHAAMTGLIVVFSALGGTLGSRITAIVFSAFRRHPRILFFTGTDGAAAGRAIPVPARNGASTHRPRSLTCRP